MASAAAAAAAATVAAMVLAAAGAAAAAAAAAPLLLAALALAQQLRFDLFDNLQALENVWDASARFERALRHFLFVNHVYELGPLLHVLAPIEREHVHDGGVVGARRGHLHGLQFHLWRPLELNLLHEPPRRCRDVSVGTGADALAVCSHLPPMRRKRHLCIVRGRDQHVVVDYEERPPNRRGGFHALEEVRRQPVRRKFVLVTRQARSEVEIRHQLAKTPVESQRVWVAAQRDGRDFECVHAYARLGGARYAEQRGERHLILAEIVPTGRRKAEQGGEVVELESRSGETIVDTILVVNHFRAAAAAAAVGMYSDELTRVCMHYVPNACFEHFRLAQQHVHPVEEERLDTRTGCVL
mmetsp:Transcript_1388/g.2622  ORF Transcript_1388/g.2622 Transcript_1388/m.2622 type:complete len:356 (-) Transcript_1388:1184-2251(-)